MRPALAGLCGGHDRTRRPQSAHATCVPASLAGRFFLYKEILAVRGRTRLGSGVKFSPLQIAEILGAELVRDSGNIEISDVASLSDAVENDLSFFASEKFFEQLKVTGAGAVLIPAECPIDAVPHGAAVLVVENPSAAFSKVAEKMRPERPVAKMGVHPSAVIDDSVKLKRDAVSIGPGVCVEAGAEIGDGSVIGANTYIGHGVKIGRDCHLYANVSVREWCELRDRVVLHHGVVVGADGFGYELVDGRQQKVDQIGNVLLENDVEVGANSAIDRARFGRTWLKEGVKIDNLVQIGHNCVIGKHTVICALTGLAGSSVIGEYVTIAAQSGVAGHIVVGDRSIIMARGGVTKSLPGDDYYFGYPAQPASVARREAVAIRKIPTLSKRIKAIERKLEEQNGGE